jgi:hypothetical protein
MSKIINFITLYVSLFIIETIGCFLIVLFYFTSDSLDFKGSFDSVILWNFWRVLFYGLPFRALYFLLFKYVGNRKLYKPLIFSFFNLFVYVTLSVLTRIIWGKNIPLSLQVAMFWITCIAIFISPIVLGKIPYFKKLMKRVR